MTMPPKSPDLDALLAHSGWVRALAHSLVADPTSADDVEQQAWVTALEHPPSHDRNLRSWWSSVVRSSAGKGWREKRRRQEIEDEFSFSQGAADSATPGDLAERHETFRRLAAAVVQLPEPYGEAIYLRYFEQMTLREVAKRQAVPLSTSRARIDRGLEKLRAMLTENLGAQWRNRCQAIAMPLAAAPRYIVGPAALAATALKSPLGIAATLLALVSVAVWAPWEAEEVQPVPEVEGKLEIVQAKQENPPEVVIARSAAEPVLAAGVGFLPSAETGSLVTVVDSNGNKPLPGAEVIVLDLGVLPMPAEYFQEIESIGGEEMLLAMGDRYRTDENAQVRIPKPLGKLVLVGRTHQHFRFLDTKSLTESATNGDDITLAVGLVETLPIKVVDQNGHVVEGAHVNLRLFDEEFAGGLVGATTNAEGLAWIKVLGGISMAPERKQFYAHLNILSDKPILAEVDIYNLPTKPVVLVMPPTGQVELVILSASGQRKSGNYIAALGRLLPLTEGQEESERSIGDGIMLRAVQGRAVFRYVALSQEVQGIVVSQDYSFQAKATSDGPTQEGETVELSVAPTGEWSFITGRVLNTEGMLAKNLALKIDITTITAERRSTSRQAIQTDSQGRFRLQVTGEIEPGSVRTVTVVMRKTKRKERRIAEKDMSYDLAPGDTELGDFVVDTPPLLLRGRVLSSAGEPVAGASIVLEYEDNRRISYHDQTASSSGGAGVMVLAEGGDSRVNWRPREDLAVKTDRDGHFAIYAKSWDCRYRIVAKHRAHKRAEKEFVPGATGFEIHLGATITVKGRILLDSNIPVQGIHVGLLSPRRTDPTKYSGYRLFANSRGYYEFTGQDPGTYVLSIRSNWLEEDFVLLEPQEIVAVDGVFTFPDIDLRGKLHAIQVSIVDEKGKRIQKGRIGKLGEPWRMPFEFQPLQLVSQSPDFHFEISADGRRREILRGLTESREIELRKGVPVRVVLDNYASLPADWDLSTTVLAVNSDGSQSEQRPTSLKLNSAGDGRADFAWPGHFRLSLRISHARNNDSIQVWVDFPGENDSSDFFVVDQEEVQEVHVTLDPVKLEQAIQEALAKEREWDNRKR
jgi:RNA polymerase sigma-70 factor (ECF subfamily)